MTGDFISMRAFLFVLFKWEVGGASSLIKFIRAHKRTECNQNGGGEVNDPKNGVNCNRKYMGLLFGCSCGFTNFGQKM